MNGIFVIGAIIIVASGDKLGLLYGAVFLPGFLLFLDQLRKPPTLELSAAGLTHTVRHKSSQYAWADVSNFGVYQLGRKRFVQFAHGQRDPAMPVFSNVIPSAQVVRLGDGFGTEPEALIELLVTEQCRAGHNEKTTDTSTDQA